MQLGSGTVQHDHELRHRRRQQQREPRTRPVCWGPGVAVTQSAPFRLVSASSPLAGRLGPDHLDVAQTWRDLSWPGKANPSQRPAQTPLPAAAPAGRRQLSGLKFARSRPAIARPRRPVPSGSGVTERRLLAAKVPASAAGPRNMPEWQFCTPIRREVTPGNAAHSRQGDTGSRSLLTLCERGRASDTCPGRPCRGRASRAVLR